MHGISQIDHPQQQQKDAWRSVVSSQRKRAVIACFQQKSLHSLPRFLFRCNSLSVLVSVRPITTALA